MILLQNKENKGESDDVAIINVRIEKSTIFVDGTREQGASPDTLVSNSNDHQNTLETFKSVIKDVSTVIKHVADVTRIVEFLEKIF